MKKALATILALVMALGLTTAAWADGEGTTANVAKIGETGYATLAEAITAAADGDTIKLLANVEAAKYTEIRKALTIDFNGCTMTSTDGGFDVYSNLTLKNGTLNALKWGAWVQSGAKLVVAEDMIINTTSTDGNKGGITVQNSGSEVTVYGKVKAAGGAAISGIGNASDGGVIINIEEGAEVTCTNPDGLGVYYPNTAKLNIKGGTITGASGVYVKSGAVSVTGGKIVATGAKVNYQYYGNGGHSTGEALVIDKCNYPGGDPTVSITGGTFTSTNAKAVGSYVGNGAAEPVTAFVTGGTFSSDVSAYTADNAPVAYNDYKYYVGEETIQDVANNLSAGDYLTIKKGTVELRNVPAGVIVCTDEGTVVFVNGKNISGNPDGYTVPQSSGYYYYQPTTDTKTTDTKGSPKTFDAGIALYVGMALTSAAGVAFVGKKRED